MTDLDDCDDLDGCDEELRLLDVLLERELAPDDALAAARRALAGSASERQAAAARAAEAAGNDALPGDGRRRHALLAAAMVVLGVAVVTGMSLLQRTGAGDRPLLAPQEPAVTAPVKPRDMAQFVELLGRANALRFERHEAFGATFVAEGNGSCDRLDTERWAEVVRYDGAKLADWQAALLDSSAHTATTNRLGTLLSGFLELRDGGTVHLFVSVDDEQHVDPGIEGSPPIVPNAALSALMTAAAAELDALHRRANGIARDADELEALPREAAHVQCPVLAGGSLAARLARFPRLASLAVQRGSGDLLPDRALLEQLRALPGLVELDLRADALDDADCAVLAHLPALARLVLRRGTASLTGAGLGASRTLREVTFRNCQGLTAEGMRGLARARGLEVLRWLDCDLGYGELLAEVPAFVSLRELAVRSDQLRAAQLEPLLRTKLQKLVLVDAPLGGPDLAALGQLPSLHELELVTPSITDAAVEDLAALRSVRQLRLQNVKLSPAGLTDLKAAMPHCAIECVPGARLFDTAHWFERR